MNFIAISGVGIKEKRPTNSSVTILYTQPDSISRFLAHVLLCHNSFKERENLECRPAIKIDPARDCLSYRNILIKFLKPLFLMGLKISEQCSKLDTAKYLSDSINIKM